MRNEPIEIDIENNWKYGEVAFFVDREDFLEDVKHARKLLKIKLLIPHTPTDVNKWKEVELNEALANRLKKSTNVVKTVKGFSFPTTNSQKIIGGLLKKYHKPIFYANIIEAAILCGIVTDSDFSVTSYVQIIDPMNYVERYKRGAFLGYPRIAIIISPETKWEEVEKVFKENAPSEKEYFTKEYLKTNHTYTDTHSSVRNHRKWYLLNKNGMSAARIWSKLKLNIEPKSVENGIAKYKKHLKTPLD